MHILIMLLLISLLILVHELGHFSVARALKIRVDKFGFGLPFGPTLWEKKIGDVTYCLHAFLLGGYVSFPDDDPDSELPMDDPQRLKNRKPWEKAAVISAGVIANILFAVVIIVGVVLFTQEIPTNRHNIYVKDFVKENPIAKKAGMLADDKVLKINNIKINTYRDFVRLLKANKAYDGYVSDIQLEDQLKNIISANPEFFKQLGLSTNNLNTEKLIEFENTVIPPFSVIKVPEIPTEPFLVPNLKDPFSPTQVLPASAKLSPSEIALKSAIVNNKFAGNGDTTFGEIAKVSADGKHLLTITVLRKGKIVNLAMAPNDKGQIGIKTEVEDVFIPATSIPQVVAGSWDYLYENTSLMCIGIYKIFTGQVDVRDLHGIVAITKVGGDIIQKNGMRDAWLLTVLISIDLAIVNLLPIPALDGGHLLFLFIEKLRGKPIDENYQEAFIKYGFLFLIGLMVLIVFNDILGIVTGKF